MLAGIFLGISVVVLIIFFVISIKSYRATHARNFSFKKGIPFELLNNSSNLVLRLILLILSFVLLVLSSFFMFDLRIAYSYWVISALLISVICYFFMSMINFFSVKLHYGLFYASNLALIASDVGLVYYAYNAFHYIPNEKLLWRQIVILVFGILFMLFHLAIVFNPKNIDLKKGQNQQNENGAIVFVESKNQVIAINEWLTLLGIFAFTTFCLISSLTIFPF